jgi:hypothetical protein
MDSTRRTFLLRAASTGTNLLVPSAASPQGQTLLRALWRLASRAPVIVGACEEKHYNLSGLLGYIGSYTGGLDRAALAVQTKDPLEFATGINRAVQDLFWFELGDDLSARTWSDIYHDQDLLTGALHHHLEWYNDGRLQFATLDELRAKMRWMVMHQDFRGTAPADMWKRAQNRIGEVLQPNALLLRGFDWLDFADRTEDDVEVMYQLLLRYKDILPPQITNELGSAYSENVYQYERSWVGTKLLRRAAMLMRFVMSNDPPSWTIDAVPRKWDDWKLQYKITASNIDAEIASADLNRFLCEMAEKYGNEVVPSEIETCPLTGKKSLIITVDEKYECDFEDMWGLSLLYRSQELMADLMAEAERQDAVNKQLAGISTPRLK